MQKNISFKVKGMQRDLAASAFSSEYAYENKNVRLISAEENTLLSLVNERGNKKSSIAGVGDCIKGTPIGQALMNDELVIFSTGDKSDLNTTITAEETDVTDITSKEIETDIDALFEDRIYKLWFNNKVLTGKVLFRGNLNFNYKYPIESVSFYENSDIKKVYWTDNLNQVRVINIEASDAIISKWNDNSFESIPVLKLTEQISVERNSSSNGFFAPGVIQYAFTYYNKYGQESNIFYTTPLYYISYNERGASPEDKISNSFSINIDNPDSTFDYIRIYSIHRTSIDATPIVKIVADLPTESGVKSYYIKEYNKAIPITSTLYNTSTHDSSTIESVTSKMTKGDNGYEISAADYNQIQLKNGETFTFESSDTIYLDTSNYIVSGDVIVPSHLTSKNASILYTAINPRLVYTDNGLSGDDVDPTELLYKGGEEITAATISYKDNTLFLGNIQKTQHYIDSEIRAAFNKNSSLVFGASQKFKKVAGPEFKGYYAYNNQLKYSSNTIKTFKYLEYYRFGVQFQYKTGKWSEPIWVNDVQNKIVPITEYNKSSNNSSTYAVLNFKNKSILNKLADQGFVKIRPVIVYPDASDREVICQGVLCPTVYNVQDRYTNSPFAQSSWFFRPNIPYNLDVDKNNWSAIYEGRLGISQKYSKAGIIYNGKYTDSSNNTIDNVNNGDWAEFRHNYAIPGNTNKNAEIQCIYNPQLNPIINNDAKSETATTWVSDNSENYYIDQSIVTLHSPDIEFDDNISNTDLSDAKLRIIGMVPLTSFYGDISIQTSTPVLSFKESTDLPEGFYKEPIGAENNFASYNRSSCFGYRQLISNPFWIDTTVSSTSTSDVFYGDKGAFNKIAYVVYPWHRNGSLNNAKSSKNGTKPAMLSKKMLSNIRYSYNNFYFKKGYIWNAYNSTNGNPGISGAAIVNSNEVTITRLPAPKNSGLSSINYYGNVDKLLTVSRVGDKKNGYPIVVTSTSLKSDEGELSRHDLFSNPYQELKPSLKVTGINSVITIASNGDITGVDPVRIKYKSSPHAVIAFNYTEDKRQFILPTILERNTSTSTDTSTYANLNYAGSTLENNQKYFWETNKTSTGAFQFCIDPRNLGITGSTHTLGLGMGWLWLGELYRDNVVNRFGGQSERVFETNNWLPCGEPVSIKDDTGGIKSEVSIVWTEGDTYYQRYDHIKTYPYTNEDQNQVTEIISFMCETHINLDGRYDRNRGQLSNFAINSSNFNLINDVYNQKNNFFNYRGLDYDKLNLSTFNNSLTWTKTKTPGELTDTWTNITLASTLDLDGDKGELRALRRFNNDIIAFQDRGISQILYNENMQIASTEGVPIEIANSGKVNGKRYISDKIGCTNKWSICGTPNGIYFVDDITKSIFLFNGQLTNISDKLGFKSWINEVSKDISIWNPVDFDGIVTYYDKLNDEVMFISKDECLGYSEFLGQFTSFYSYEKVPYFSNLKDRGISFNTSNDSTLYSPWLHNEGDYNMFFGKYQPFYITVIANPDMQVDKIFNNIEFRSDSWDSNGNLLNTTFDTLTTWNEYQEGSTDLVNTPDRPSSLKKKFRIWRANIPRSKSNGRDRMRNPWLYIKLSKESENNDKTILHDIVVHYFE